MEKWLRELRHALRFIGQDRLVTLVAVATLALGIGPTTVIFSAVSSLLLRPISFDPHGRVVVLEQTFAAKAGASGKTVSYPTFHDWQQASGSFEALGAYQPVSVNLQAGDRTERVSSVRTSASFFQVLGFAAAEGRLYSSEDDRPGQAKVVVMSHRLWRDRFGRDPGLVGKSLEINGAVYTLVGVLPEASDYENYELWMPLALDPSAPRGDRRLVVMGRLLPTVSLAKARAELTGISERLAQAYPDTDTGARVSIKPLRDWFLGEARYAVLILLGAVVLVLSIACVNVANLLLARLGLRHREVALRFALGASRGAVVRQFLLESVLRALGGGLIGLALAWAGLAAVEAALPFRMPSYFRLRLDPASVAFCFLVASLCGVLFGLLPSLQASKSRLEQVLREGGGRSGGSRRQQRLRNAFVVSEVALALVLLISASLLVVAFSRLRESRPGYATDHLLTFSLNLPDARYDLPGSERFYRNLLDRMEAVPGIKAAAAIQNLPLTSGMRSAEIELAAEDRAATARHELSAAIGLSVSPRLFEAFAMPLLAGRGFATSDSASTEPVVVVSQRLAEAFWPGKDSLGKQLAVQEAGGERRLVRVVGVVGPARLRKLNEEPGFEVYFPLSQRPRRAMSLALRTEGKPTELTDAVLREVRAADADLPVSRMASMAAVVDDSIYILKIAAWLLGAFGLVAAVLAAVGIYGVAANLVAQRTHEIGIRMALGADRKAVLRLLFLEGGKLLAVGVAVGLALALGLTRLMSSLLYGVSAADGGIFLSAALLLALVGFAALYLPARRATGLEPTQVLKAA
ncbi:MAG: ABC transporter permease [Thermoanaerobaculia bacterium]